MVNIDIECMFINVKTYLSVCKYDVQSFKLLCNIDTWTQVFEQCYIAYITYNKGLPNS